VPGIGFAAERLADPVYRVEDPAADAVIARVPDSELFSEPAVKLRARHPGRSPDEILALAASACSGIVEVSHNGAAFLEGGPPGVTKATALGELAASYGIGRESVLAFGGMPNDLPMLTWAGTSCAVADAHPRVLAAVTHVIGACDDDGVAAFLEGLYDGAAGCGGS
jgi:hydroxymethylpyrimidine pyrophosphatase-like HAD family hydrolase